MLIHLKCPCKQCFKFTSKLPLMKSIITSSMYSLYFNVSYMRKDRNDGKSTDREKIKMMESQ